MSDSNKLRVLLKKSTKIGGDVLHPIRMFSQTVAIADLDLCLCDVLILRSPLDQLIIKMKQREWARKTSFEPQGRIWSLCKWNLPLLITMLVKTTSPIEGIKNSRQRHWTVNTKWIREKRRNQLQKKINKHTRGYQISHLYDQLIQRASPDDDVTKTRSRSAITTVWENTLIRYKTSLLK